MSDLIESLSMPYVFPDENAFVLGIGTVIVGLLFFVLAWRDGAGPKAVLSDEC